MNLIIATAARDELQKIAMQESTKRRLKAALRTTGAVVLGTALGIGTTELLRYGIAKKLGPKGTKRLASKAFKLGVPAALATAAGITEIALRHAINKEKKRYEEELKRREDAKIPRKRFKKLVVTAPNEIGGATQKTASIMPALGRAARTMTTHGVAGGILGAGAGALTSPEGGRLQGAMKGGLIGAGAGLLGGGMKSVGRISPKVGRLQDFGNLTTLGGGLAAGTVSGLKARSAANRGMM